MVFATERMDADPGWEPLAPGELVHVDADLSIDRRVVFDGPPAHQLRFADLAPTTAAAQQEGSA